MTLRKTFAIFLTLISALVFTGCSQNPNFIYSNDGKWYEEYVQISSGDILLCLWTNEVSRTMDCDLEHLNSYTVPEGITPTDIQQDDDWEEQEVNLPDGKVILCLWYGRQYRGADRSCDWNYTR